MSSRVLLISVAVIVAAVAVYRAVNSAPSPRPDEFVVSRSTSPGATVTSSPIATCTGIPTPAQTAGPYYKTGSPERRYIAEGVAGEKLVITGNVFNKNCEPVAGAWLDYWQADSKGAYDNNGFTLRGHQYTEVSGIYRLETIIPAAYESRPPHIHVKVRSGNDPILTSQLYFPGQSQNRTDSIFNAALVMTLNDTASGKSGEFNFVLNQ